MKKRLIIFSDYGLDDACALAYLLDHAGRFDGVDVVCVAGNAPAHSSLLNAQKLLDNYAGGGRPLQNIRLVSTDDFLQEYACLPSIHGEDGMGDLFPKPVKIDALSYAEWLASLPKAAVVLSLGPCTVSLDAVKRLKNPELVIMAGMVNAAPNHLGMEFNQALDPGSFNAQLKFPHKIATLDTCRMPQFNLAGRRFEGGRLLYRLINRANELAEARHPDNSYIYDFITALYLIEPQLFETRSVTDPWGNQLSELRVADEHFSLGEYVKGLEQ